MVSNNKRNVRNDLDLHLYSSCNLLEKTVDRTWTLCSLENHQYWLCGLHAECSGVQDQISELAPVPELVTQLLNNLDLVTMMVDCYICLLS